MRAAIASNILTVCWTAASIIIQTPDGKRRLVGGGPDPAILLAALGRCLAPWQRTLDLVALTYPDEDHLAGLIEALSRYRVGVVPDTRLPHGSPGAQA